MRSRFKLPMLAGITAGLTLVCSYIFFVNKPRREAEEIAGAIRSRDWRSVYQKTSKSRMGAAWTEGAFVAFVRKYIEPNGDFSRVTVKPYASDLLFLDSWSVEVASKWPDRPMVFQVATMPLSTGKLIPVGRESIALRWEYNTHLSESSLMYLASRVNVPVGTVQGSSLSDPFHYEFLLSEGKNLREMGCQKLFAGSTRDDIAFHIDSIEQHARLDKVARFLVPIAAKHGRKMKYPPTAAELAMK